MCVSCLPTQPDDQQKQNAINEAQQRANQEKKPFAVYKEAGSYQVRPAFEAFADGVAPVVSAIISPNNAIAII
jgi:hypothetical protein